MISVKTKNASDYTEKDWSDLREKVVNKIYNEMFERRISPNSHEDWEEKSFFGGGTSEKYKELIRNLIAAGFKVKGGYRASSKIRGSHEHIILWKEK